MKKIDVLKIPALFCKVLYMIIVIAGIGTTVVFVHLQIDPQYYHQWNASFLSQNAMLSYKVFERWNTDLAKEYTLLSLAKISKMSLILNYLQVMGILSLILFTIKEFSNVIESVRSIETFHQRNTLSFRKMYKYLFIIFILSSVTIINAQEANFYGYSLQLTPLILSVSAFIMTEIFKQGNQLFEENKLTI
jgi:hypothetical protein